MQAQLETDDIIEPRTTFDTTTSDLLDRPSTSSGNNILNEAMPTAIVKVTPEQVRPYPKAPPRKMTGNRGGRKPGRCRILTDTPEKLEVLAIKQEKDAKKAAKLAAKEKRNDSMKNRPIPKPPTCKKKTQSRKFLIFDDSSTTTEEMPKEDSDSVSDNCDWPPQPMEIEDDDINEPLKAGDFCLTVLIGKKSTRNYVVEVLDVDEPANVYSVKYLKKVDSTRNNFVYDKDEIYEISCSEIIFKLPKPILNSSRGRAQLSFGVDFSGYKVE